MSNRTNVINNLLLLALTVVAVFVATFIGNLNFKVQLLPTVCLFLVGAIIFALLNTVVHEFGHVIAGKKNKFEFYSMRVFLWTFYKNNGKIKGYFTGLKEELGATEMLPVGMENLEKRFKNLAKGGIFGSLLMLILSIIPLVTASFFADNLWWLYAILSMGFPVSLYFFLGNGLPMSNEGILNDSAVIYGINKGNDDAKVTLGLLKIHSELMRGKSPAEIDEKLFYDLPQLPEDDPNFIILLNNRYSYELDRENYEKLNKISSRLEGLLDDMPRIYQGVVMADLLYNACAINLDEEKADNLVEDNEKYLNKVNNFTNLRIKAAYLLYVVKETAQAKEFIEKAERELLKCKIPGIIKFETKLINKIKADLANEKEIN